MSKELNMGEKVILAIYSIEIEELDKKITKEDVAVSLWKIYPKDFCLRGYPQYPNSDIPKYFTKLLENNLIIGNVHGYKLTEKGKKFAEELNIKSFKENSNHLESKEIPRFLETELKRILTTNVFNAFLENNDVELVESDLFEFLGTSSRSFMTKDNSSFISRYNLIVKDLIMFCNNNLEKNSNYKIIISLWEKLENLFSKLLKEKIK